MIHWNVDPVAFSLGPITVRWYGILFLAGFYLGFFFLQWVCRKEKKPPELIDSLLVYAILGTTIGARLVHCLFYEWNYYSDHLFEILMVWKGGLASHGGALGLITGLILFTRKYRQFPMMWMLDRTAVPTALSSALIRFGNLMNSEIIGKPTDRPWAFIFEKIDLVPRHPAQIYEALMYIFVWLSGLWLYRRYKYQPPKGLLFGWTIGVIFSFRIFIELLKENQEAFEADMSFNMGQWLSFPFAVFGLYLFFRALRYGKKSN
jgi:phosphatidylglycerol---prolipoprotein diacylglyceryl transferase